MSEEQMKKRCPDSIFIAQALLPNYDLCYRSSSTDNYASVDPSSNQAVPILIWSITDSDMDELDRCEGVGNPLCYIKEKTRAICGSKTIKGYIYRLPEIRPFGNPANTYRKKIHDAYERLGFNKWTHILDEKY